MAWKKVTNYWLGYSLDKRQFSFYYQIEGEAAVHQISTSPEETVGLADMFRNEGPVHYNTNGKYFVTAEEAVGEGEFKT